MPKKYMEDDEVVKEDVILVDGKEYTVSMIRKDGLTYIQTRDIADILNLDVSNEGRIPKLDTKK